MSEHCVCVCVCVCVCERVSGCERVCEREWVWIHFIRSSDERLFIVGETERSMWRGESSVAGRRDVGLPGLFGKQLLGKRGLLRVLGFRVRVEGLGLRVKGLGCGG